jgi:hypothetical protein
MAAVNTPMAKAMIRLKGAEIFVDRLSGMGGVDSFSDMGKGG